jgi:reactive intermediate/imine deaminase
MQLDNASIESAVHRVFLNLRAVAEAAGGGLNDIVKLNVFLTDLGNFPVVNEIMAKYFAKPYQARAAIGVRELPRGASVEMDAILELP